MHTCMNRNANTSKYSSHLCKDFLRANFGYIVDRLIFPPLLPIALPNAILCICLPPPCVSSFVNYFAPDFSFPILFIYYQVR